MNRWLKIGLLSLGVLIGTHSIYATVYEVPFLSYRTLSKASAYTGTILIGLSLFLGPLKTFFPEHLSRFLPYRRELGIIGFFYGSWHGFLVSSLYLIRDNKSFDSGILLPTDIDYIYYLTGAPDVITRHPIGVLTGMVGLSFFVLAFLISNKPAMQRLKQQWRKVLRYLTYTGFIMILVHIILLKTEEWIFMGAQGTYALSFFIALFIVVILVFRLIVAFKDSHKDHPHIEEHLSDHKGQ